MKKRKIRNRKFSKTKFVLNKIKIACLLLLINNSFYILDKQIEYHNEIEKVEEYKDETNDNFIEFVNRNNIKNINIISVGNSIASGYSMNDDIIPLMYRNEELINNVNKIANMNIYNYSRPQNNRDSHVLEWVLDNYSLSDLNEMNKFDLREDSNMPVSNVTKENIDKYYGQDSSLTINDIVNSKSDMNIIVYNGCTGKFLDELTRNGKLSLDCFEDDLDYINTFCSYIYMTNSDVQIYLCGIPNYLNIGTTKSINKKIKELSEKYPNVVYVEPAPCNIIQKKDGELVYDIHYNYDEYSIHCNNIYNSIQENYISTKITTEVYNELIILNQEKEFNPDIDINPDIVIKNILDKYPTATSEEVTNALSKVKLLFESNYGSYFCFIPKDEVLTYQYKKN